VSKIKRWNCHKLYLALFAQEIREIELSENSVMEHLSLFDHKVQSSLQLYEGKQSLALYLQASLVITLALSCYTSAGHKIVSVKELQVPWDPGGTSCTYKVTKRQLEDKLNFQGAVMSCPASVIVHFIGPIRRQPIGPRTNQTREQQGQRRAGGWGPKIRNQRHVLAVFLMETWFR
jgi:hypothetical protein